MKRTGRFDCGDLTPCVVAFVLRVCVFWGQMVLKRIGIMGAVAMVEFYGKNGGASLGAGGAADSGM